MFYRKISIAVHSLLNVGWRLVALSAFIIITPACTTTKDHLFSDADLSALEKGFQHHDPEIRWQSQSLLIGALRASGQHERLTAFLEERIVKESDLELINQAILAQVKNDLLDDSPKRAISRLDLTQRLFGKPWLLRALRLRVEAELALGDNSAAIITLDRIIKEAPEGDHKAEARYVLARLEAASGNLEKAKRLLNFTIDAKIGLDPHLVRASEHALDQLSKSRGPNFRTLDELIKSLSNAFEQGSPESLSKLLDPRNFKAGPLGTTPLPRDAAWLESLYMESRRRGKRPNLPASPIRLNDNTNSKIFVLSYNWLGDPSLDAWLQLSRESDGWRWEALRFIPPLGNNIRQAKIPIAGLGSRSNVSVPKFTPRPVVFHNTPNTGSACTPPPNAPNDGQPLTFELRAPWAAGQSMLAGTWFLGDPTPVIGGECTDLMGWPGQYYMQGNHGVTFAENYAIDFTRWGTRVGACPMPWPPFVFPCPWPWPSPGNTAVAVSQGRVTFVGGVTNTVRIEHLDNQNVPTGYESSYLHMVPVLVQEGQFVARGTVLGIVGAQGTAEAHLHFHLRRNTGGGLQPVMPSPMDGITLNWCGTRQCIRSSNGDTFIDQDGDNVLDTFDNCPGVPNPYVANAAGNLEQPDTNGDGWGDACSCANDADCAGTAFCDSTSGPPTCRTPICVNDNDCSGPSRCLGSGASAYCTAPANIMDCSDVQIECLIGYEEVESASSCMSISYDTSYQPGEDPCQGIRRHPASAHEAECLSASQELANHIPCIPR